MPTLNPITAIGGVADKILGRFKASPEERLEREKLQLEYSDKAAARQHDINMAQLKINLADAGSGRLFQSGWRPFFGWVAGCGFAYQILIQPLLGGVLAKWIALAPLDSQQQDLLQYIAGGMVIIRGAEKTVALVNRRYVKQAVVEKGGDHADA